MEYGITADGFSMRRLDEIYNDSCKRFEDEIGVNPSENPQSLINVLFTIFADAPAELWEAFAASYQQLFPNTAEGIALDNAMQIGGVNRIGQARTKYTLSCTGREGTVIPAGALVQSSTYPQRQFQAKGVSTISSANWRRIGIRPIESVSGTITFEFGVSRNATSGEVGSYSESASITKQLSVSSYSDAYAYATDINGTRQYVEFTRVNDVYLLLSVKVTSAGGLDDDFEARIKSLLMEEILSAGTSVRLQKFIRPIMENVSGVDYIEIRGLLSERPDIEGVEDSAMLTGVVPVSINQQPVVTMNGIRVVKA